MKAIFFKQCMYRGKTFAPGDSVNVENEADKPAYARWEWETEEEAANGEPLPERGADAVLILGDAPSMLEDISKLDLPEKYEVMAVNRSAFRWRGPVHYWVSVHGNFLKEWRKVWERLGLGRGVKPVFIATHPWEGFEHWSRVTNPEPGGSLTVALNTAKEMGFREVYVAGAPLDGNYSRFGRPASRLVAGLKKNGVKVEVASGFLKGVK